MIQTTVTNLYPFIVSQLPRRYRDYNVRTHFDDTGIPLVTCLHICKGLRHYLTVSYDPHTEEFIIYLRKPQGTANKVIIPKYA